MRDEKGRFVKGFKPHNKGLKGYTNSGTFKKNEKHPGWKDDEVGYSGIHKWIVRNFGKADHCEDCGKIDCNRYEWASIDHSYKRNIKYWTQLCKKCHTKLDGYNIVGLIKHSRANRKAVIAYKEGFNKKYKSITKASEDLILDVSAICKVLKGKRKTTKGYKFKYI